MATIGIVLFISLIVLVAAITGYQTGLVQQVGALAGVVLGIMVCQALGDSIAGYFTNSGTAPDEAAGITAVTYLALFIVVYLLVYLVSSMVRGVLRTFMLGPIDRLGGMAFRVIEWMLFLCLVVFAFTNLFHGFTLLENPILQFLAGIGETVIGAV